MATNSTDVLERRLGLSLRDEKAAAVIENFVNSVFMENYSKLRIVANV